ncbi:MAG TPA: urea ABC transporter permease subunit UrtB [Candidatus Baltobacteraceae bacterium]|jgi:urea transport system permease protein|nr:urea ABC transporter permease subunit UrtB [Candidatus Baltobacteraceae bacterium]
MKLSQLLLVWLLSGGVFFGCLSARADTAPDSVVRKELVQAIQSEGPTQQKLLNELAESGAIVVHDVLTAWVRDGVYLYDSPDGSKIPILLDDQLDGEGKARAIRIIDGQFVKDAGGKELRFAAADLNNAEADMRLRASIQQSMDTLALSAPSAEERNSAVLKLGNSLKPRYIPILRARLAKETDPGVRRSIDEGIALLQLADPDPKVEIAAVQHLAQLKSIGSLEIIKGLMNKPGCAADVVKACGQAVNVIDEHISFVNFIGTIFHGLSLGSILLVVALGLAITFGLMGIINMAHGEMIAVGAYTCYVVQNIFGSGFGFSITLPFSFGGKMLSFGLHTPGFNATGWWYESYYLFAIPLSFLMAALAGLAIERTVIRFLYRRPLESLLATWGISLVMQQLFRMVFGANNVQVNSPSWLLGHFSLNDVTFDYNRVFVIVFAIVIVVGTWLLLTKTPLGLMIRAVMQNRAMAASLGVRTARVNMLTFAFGSGLAGLAGSFLSQIGNVGPSLGQTYIVDSFMTVVLGGVGSIVGTVCSAFGIGTADEVLQQTTGSPVTGKIVVLVAIILFLQWKPGGLFASRSRSLD